MSLFRRKKAPEPLVAIAPDKFKGTLTAVEAAEVMRRALADILPSARVEVCPMADAFPDGRPQQLPLRRCNVRAMAYRQLPCLRFWAKCNDRYLMADKDLTKPTEIEFCTGSFSA